MARQVRGDARGAARDCSRAALLAFWMILLVDAS
jgi:hypothetical protein